RHHYGSLDGSPAGDADMDGLTDEEEWQAGTDPKDATDTLAVTVSIAPEGDTLYFRFRNAPGRRYELAFSRDFRRWETVSDASLEYDLGTGRAAFSVPADTLADAGFLRVMAAPVTVSQR